MSMDPTLEGKEYTVSTIESEKRKISIKRDKSNPEGSVAIEMSSQPLLELTPVSGRPVFPFPLQSYCIKHGIIKIVPPGVGVSEF